jgi:hypothetical protein
MVRWVLVSALVFYVSGCAGLVGGEAARLLLPSLDSCADVQYSRHGDQVQLRADCVFDVRAH